MNEMRDYRNPAVREADERRCYNLAVVVHCILAHHRPSEQCDECAVPGFYPALPGSTITGQEDDR